MIGDLAAAASNLYSTTVGKGLADLRRMPATAIDRGPQRTLSRYDSSRRRSGAPLLLVPPLAAPAICFDLPVAACHHIGDLGPNTSTALESAPGGHLGVLTGRAARGTTWKLLDAFV